MKDSIRCLDTFDNSDRVAVLLIHRGSKRTQQELTTIVRGRSRSVQVFLHRQNQHGFDIYLGMNPLKEDSSGRTKTNLAAIRHLYLDCDDDGDGVLERVLEDGRLPSPHSVVQAFQSQMANRLERVRVHNRLGRRNSSDARP